MRLTKEDIALATMAAGEKGARFEPVQIQKILFLIDEEISKSIDGPHFNFQPYDYGPFDRGAYTVMDSLSEKGEVSIAPMRWYRTYALTDEGYEKGRASLDSLGDSIKKNIEGVVKWAYELSSEELVSAVYERYPEMKKRSVSRA